MDSETTHRLSKIFREDLSLVSTGQKGHSLDSWARGYESGRDLVRVQDVQLASQAISSNFLLSAKGRNVEK